MSFLNMEGRWFTRNKSLVAVHLNPAAMPGNRVERWLGHSIPQTTYKEKYKTKDGVEVTATIETLPIKICWNENGECVWVQGVVDDVKNYDLMECINGKDRVEAKMKVEGCKICTPEESKVGK